MSDIVARLRDHKNYSPLHHEAADEIERLFIMAEMRGQEIERLRGIEQFASEASRHERDGLRAEIERLREHVDALRLVATANEPEALRLREELADVRADAALLRAALAGKDTP